MRNRQSFVQGAMILTAAGIISKLLGAVYRIPFANLVGNEGIGLYQMAYPIYTALLALSTAGVPVAVSIMVAETKTHGDIKGAHRILTSAVLMLGVLGAIFSVSLYGMAGFIAERIFYDVRAEYCLKLISPALFFTAVVSPLRGYFQGNQNMIPTAVSQIIEQLVRVVTVFVGAMLLMPYGIAYAAAGATFGAVTGSFGALIVLIIFYITSQKRQRGQTSLGYWTCIKRLTKLAIPVCLGGLVMPLMQGIDAMVVPLRLRTAGYDAIGATSLYGELTGMAGPLINLPGVVTIALAASVVPIVSAALSQGKLKLLQARVEEAIRMAILISLPAAVGLVVLAREVSYSLYALPTMGTTLAALAPATFFLGMHQASAGVLQGLGRTALPVRNLLIGAMIKLIVTYSLTGMPGWGIKGAALGSVFGFAVPAVLNLLPLKHILPKPIELDRLLLKPVFAATIMAVTLYFSKEMFVLSRITGLLLVGVGGLIYASALIIVGEIKSKEISLIPIIGPELARILLNVGIVRE
jgi:stage V sporulation protein B